VWLVSGNAIELLKSHGLNVTAQRLAIVEAVERNPHVTADQVVEMARDHLGAISRQSVYDTLGTLTSKGLLRRIQPVGSGARYETRVGDNHHHVICRGCGRLEDVDCARGAAPCLDAANGHGFTIDEAEVVYWGQCPSCATDGAGPTGVQPSATSRSHPTTA